MKTRSRIAHRSYLLILALLLAAPGARAQSDGLVSGEGAAFRAGAVTGLAPEVLAQWMPVLHGVLKGVDLGRYENAGTPLPAYADAHRSLSGLRSLDSTAQDQALQSLAAQLGSETSLEAFLKSEPAQQEKLFAAAAVKADAAKAGRQRTEQVLQAGAAALQAPVIPEPSPAAAPAAETPKPAPAPVPAPAVKKMGPITKVTEDGFEHPLSFDPAAPKPPFYQRVWNAVRDIPQQIRRIAAFKSRVDELVAGVSDEKLTWALSRLDTLKNQEGILRNNNSSLVHQWKGGDLKAISHNDFAPSSLNWDSLAFLFKQAMDREEPTKQYQFTSAHNLHNHLPRVSHFMGTTLQERILQVALKGKAGQQSIWASEELRHGPITERVWNLSREPGHPELTQQGIASKQPETGEYSAHSMMANRSLAELGAGMAALTIKANTVKDSPTDKTLHGWYLDEVYHYVMMSAATYVAYGETSRLSRLFSILRHSFDYPMPTPGDVVIHARSFPSPLVLAEIGYAFLAIDGRVSRYLKNASVQTLRDWVGPVYPTDKDVADAIARGEHTWTEAARTEQNPELTQADIEDMIRRFPGQYSLEHRSVKSSTIRQILGTYRNNSLAKPAYWMRKRGFAQDPENASALKRALPGAAGSYLKLEFTAAGAPVASVWQAQPEGGAQAVFSGSLENMSMLQIGAFMDAENLDVVKRLEDTKAGLSDEEILKNLGKSSSYQENPLRLIKD